MTSCNDASHDPVDRFDCGLFVLSLDFELYWGVHDHTSIEQYRQRLEGVPEVIDRLLELFGRYEIHCTWATVGAMFARNGEVLRDYCPTNRPSYDDPQLSPYAWIDSGGPDRYPDLHFAPELIDRIKSVPGQAIGSHTFSHYYCLEPGQTLEQFSDDLGAAVALAHSQGVKLRSLVLPRDQVSPGHLACAAALGFTAYRGVERHWTRQPRSKNETSALQRVTRLADAYLNVSGANVHYPSDCYGRELINVPSSRFLRAHRHGHRLLRPLHRRRIRGAMTRAAETNGLFHLWWHPHNFGLDPKGECAAVERILLHFVSLRERCAFASVSIEEVVARDPVSAHVV